MCYEDMSGCAVHRIRDATNTYTQETSMLEVAGPVMGLDALEPNGEIV